MPSGKYEGILITRLPMKYLLYQVNSVTSLAVVCQAELDRRGTHIPTIDVTGHAMDQASLRILPIWLKKKKKNEGFHAWLCRVAQAALTKGVKNKEEMYSYKSMLFVFDESSIIPVLKTVMLNPKRIRRK